MTVRDLYAGHTIDRGEFVAAALALGRLRRIAAYEGLGYSTTTEHRLPKAAEKAHTTAADLLGQVARGDAEKAYEQVLTLTDMRFLDRWAIRADAKRTLGREDLLQALPQHETGEQVPLKHLSLTLDEMHDARMVLLFAACTTHSTVAYKTFPKNRRGVTENQYQRIAAAMRWDFESQYADRPNVIMRRVMREATGSDYPPTPDEYAAILTARLEDTP